jgi:hypothetical protein
MIPSSDGGGALALEPRVARFEPLEGSCTATILGCAMAGTWCATSRFPRDGLFALGLLVMVAPAKADRRWQDRPFLFMDASDLASGLRNPRTIGAIDVGLPDEFTGPADHMSGAGNVTEECRLRLRLGEGLDLARRAWLMTYGALCRHVLPPRTLLHSLQVTSNCSADGDNVAPHRLGHGVDGEGTDETNQEDVAANEPGLAFAYGQ